ncbi:histo-blood group ABO system transferase 1-like [Neolamprologus brichardi]|uniref:histo-blood group ABO system transferase 1-like n=1 Tax=Neolamprologus brichardi TaxID=32507 RepID=UPI001643815C|nr:histo-blood group ABO system transferase 1-like [Neolamprologus brichardi]
MEGTLTCGDVTCLSSIVTFLINLDLDQDLLQDLDLTHKCVPKSLKYNQPSIVHGRADVVTVTPWLAPVVWEGTFNPFLLDSIYKRKNITIAATVFAVGKYIMFLKDFLETSEEHFFVGFRVDFYVFTDRPNEVPKVNMAAGRMVTVRSVPSSNRWQEISARRMEIIQNLIEKKLQNRADYIFCLDVDSKFHEVQIIRFSGVIKNYANIRPN